MCIRDRHDRLLYQNDNYCGTGRRCTFYTKHIANKQQARELEHNHLTDTVGLCQVFMYQQHSKVNYLALLADDIIFSR